MYMHLLAEDWRSVAEAFEANADPRFNDRFTPCCSRALSPRLLFDL